MACRSGDYATHGGTQTWRLQSDCYTWWHADLETTIRLLHMVARRPGDYNQTATHGGTQTWRLQSDCYTWWHADLETTIRLLHMVVHALVLQSSDFNLLSRSKALLPKRLADKYTKLMQQTTACACALLVHACASPAPRAATIVSTLQ